MTGQDLWDAAVAFLTEHVGPGSWMLGGGHNDGTLATMDYGRDDPQYWQSVPLTEWPPHLKELNDELGPPRSVCTERNVDCIGRPRLVQNMATGECWFSPDEVITSSPIVYYT